MKYQVEIDNAIDQLGQALHNADEHYDGIIEKDRIQCALRTLMSISDSYKKYRKQKFIKLYKMKIETIQFNQDEIDIILLALGTLKHEIYITDNYKQDIVSLTNKIIYNENR